MKQILYFDAINRVLAGIFTNLIDNAIKYTNKGEVVVSIKRNSKSQIEVEVKDTGIGIADHYLESLYKPFTQEDQGYTRRFEGNGLGLALVQKYAELNNAKIKVDSKKGIGSSFNSNLQLMQACFSITLLSSYKL